MRKGVAGIYRITNPEGCIYIGQSYNIHRRWSVIKCRKRPWELLFQSIQRFGVEAHKFEIIHSLPQDVDQSVLDQYERLYISQHRECGYALFNKESGGKWAGHKLSEETKNKIRNTLTGVKHTSERTSNFKRAMQGKWKANIGSFKPKAA